MAGNSKNEKLIGGILPESKARDLLYKMVLTRTFEENAEEMYALGKVHGTMHLSIGQEAIAAGSSPALKKSDYLLNTHRGPTGHFLMWGGDLNRMMAEFMGKEAGYCRGRGRFPCILPMSRAITSARRVSWRAICPSRWAWG
jgi:Pyruvate/2-oxoglutarate dehydrogenase complex, dehydrogenase (E1) component, eukaryotic type, alpha subunit